MGAIRAFETADHVWIGGRLAVLADYRQRTRIGATLVAFLERMVVDRGASALRADIQIQHVDFFQRLAWRPVGSARVMFGVEQVPMASSFSADLAFSKLLVA